MGSLSGFAHAALHAMPWRAVAAGVGTAGLLRLALPARPGVAAACATALGWALLTWPAVLHGPRAPLAALPVLALLGWACEAAAERWGGWIRLWLLPALAAWWLRDAPASPMVVQIVPVALALAAALALARRGLRGAPAGWAVPGAAAGFALALAWLGAHPAWIAAAIVPGAAALVWWRQAEAASVLGPALVLAAAALVLAADRGRLNAFDAAAAVPVLALFLAPHLRRGAPARKRRTVRRKAPARNQPKATSLS